MIPGQSIKINKTSEKIEEFVKQHSDMEDELKRRVLSLRKKNIRNFLKQINSL